MDWFRHGLRRMRAVAPPPAVQRFETPQLVMGGTFRCRHLRDGRVIDEWEKHNLIVNEGLDHILGVEFTGVPRAANWYLGLFGNNYTPVATDSAASFAGNAGEITNYTNGQRLGFTGAEGQQQVNNSAAPALFTFTGTSRTTVYGAFLISSAGLGSTAGTLFCASSFASSKGMDPNDQLSVVYAVAAQSA